MLTLLSRPNKVGLKCPSVHTYVLHTYIRTYGRTSCLFTRIFFDLVVASQLTEYPVNLGTRVFFELGNPVLLNPVTSPGCRAMSHYIRP